MNFEEWAESEGLNTTKWMCPAKDYIYCDGDVNNMFKAWKASKQVHLDEVVKVAFDYGEFPYNQFIIRKIKELKE